MRSLLIVSCLIALTSAAAKDDFVTKLRKTIVFWNAGNLGKITDAIILDVCRGKTMDQIGESEDSSFQALYQNSLDGMSYVQPNTPLFDFPKLLSLMSTCDKCLKNKKTGTKTMEVIGKALTVFQNQLKGPYGVIKQKCDTMTANKKTDAQKLNQGYLKAMASLTDNLIQKIVTNSAKKMTANEWSCALEALPKVVDLKRFNTVRQG